MSERAGRVTVGALVVAMVAFWVWIFAMWSGVIDRPGNPDRLEERAFPEQADAICATALAGFDELPNARETPTPAERAVPVAEGTRLVAVMVAELWAASTDLTVDRDVELVERWLGDWDAYVADRERHVIRLESADDDSAGRDLAFTLTERAGGGLYTVRMDGFATANEMDACVVPGDI